MKIYNEIIMQWNDKTQQFDIIYENSFNYSGDLILFQNTNSTTTSNGQISTSDDTINTDSEWSDLWEGENIKEYTEAVYDRISQLLIEKFTEIESAIGADGIESIQKTWEDGEIKIGKKDSDILVVYENDIDANRDDMDEADFAFTNPPDLAMQVQESFYSHRSGIETRGTDVLAKAQLAGRGITLIMLGNDLLMQDPDWLIDEALHYRDHSRE